MTELKADDLKTLQNILKSLTKELKKFSIDPQSMKSHAAEYLSAEKEKEESKKKAKYEATKKAYKATQSDVYNLVEELCSGFTRNSLFSEDVDEDITWYAIEEYLLDNHKQLVDKWRLKLTDTHKELADDFMAVVPEDDKKEKPVQKKTSRSRQVV